MIEKTYFSNQHFLLFSPCFQKLPGLSHHNVDWVKDIDMNSFNIRFLKPPTFYGLKSAKIQIDFFFSFFRPDLTSGLYSWKIRLHVLCTFYSVWSCINTLRKNCPTFSLVAPEGLNLNTSAVQPAWYRPPVQTRQYIEWLLESNKPSGIRFSPNSSPYLCYRTEYKRLFLLLAQG